MYTTTCNNRSFCLFREVSKPERFSGDNIIYKPIGENAPDMVYMGSLTNFDLSYAWSQDKCVPLVREITFENGEVSFHRSSLFSWPYAFVPICLHFDLRTAQR